jgi:hypothetical protein
MLKKCKKNVKEKKKVIAFLCRCRNPVVEVRGVFRGVLIHPNGDFSFNLLKLLKNPF